jgi:DNA integrity scanning protein DisA with diadenylate cyclase activity
MDAVKSMSGSNTGALIVFSKNSPLKFYAESGDLIDAIVSKRIILSIFNKYSPLHDGAVIIHANRIKAARCILPVTERDDLPAEFGLRHRAAIGMTESTDTLVLVVSEETGQMSVVRNGNIFHNLSIKEIRAKVNDYLYEDDGRSDDTPEKEEVVPTQKKEEVSASKSVSTS